MALSPGTKVRILRQPVPNEYCRMTNHDRYRDREGEVLNTYEAQPGLVRVQVEIGKDWCGLVSAHFHEEGLLVLDEYQEL